MEIAKKTVIVTGGANGIGKELVKQLLNKGAKVCALDISKDGLELLERELDNDNLITYVVDMSKKEEIVKFYDDFNKEGNKLDILINNAGIVQPFVPTVELTDEAIDRVMNINFFGPVKLTRLFLKDLMANENGGFIANVSSMGGFFPFPNQTIYGASKAALKLFTEGVYAECEGTKVGCMVVLPGAIETDILKNSGAEYKPKSDVKEYKMTSAGDTAAQIIDGIEKNKFRVFIGSDSKFMNILYKLNSKKAIAMINKKMG